MEDLYQPVAELRVFGGGAKSRIWLQIIADITGKQVVPLFTSEAGSIGAAILAASAAGLFGSPEEAFEHLRLEPGIEPRSDRLSHYGKRFEDYQAIQSKLLKD
jgi:sugar (pentulose or hexulose) kinase